MLVEVKINTDNDSLFFDSTSFIHYCAFCDKDVFLYDGVHCERCKNDLLNGVPQELQVLIGDSKLKCIDCNGSHKYYIMCGSCWKFYSFVTCSVCNNTSTRRGQCSECDSTFKDYPNPCWGLEKDIFIKHCQQLLLDEAMYKLLGEGKSEVQAYRLIDKQKIYLKASKLYKKKIQKINDNLNKFRALGFKNGDKKCRVKKLKK